MKPLFQHLFLLLLINSCQAPAVSPESKSTNLAHIMSGAPFMLEPEIADENRNPLLLSKDFGQSWENVSKGLPKHIQVSFLEQMGSELVIATDNEGIFFSEANQSKWKATGKELPSAKINALYIDQATIYVGVYRAGIFRTSDAGTSWEAMNTNLPNLNVQAICKTEGQLLVGTDEGIFRKVDKEWRPTNIQTQVLSLYEQAGRIVAGTSKGTAISIDEGATWTWVRTAGAVHYTHPVGNSIVELTLHGDLVYSNDWGKSWEQAEYEPREGSYVYEIVEVGPYQLISNNYGIHRSVDGGKTWEHIFHTEAFGFFDLLVVDNLVYGGTRSWDEYRKRRQ